MSLSGDYARFPRLTFREKTSNFVKSLYRILYLASNRTVKSCFASLLRGSTKNLLKI